MERADQHEWTINFQRVKTLEYGYQFTPDVPDSANANFSIGGHIQVRNDLKSIRLLLSVDVSVELDEEERDVASVILEFIFSVEGLAESAESVDELKLPYHLVSTVYHLCISTTRGVLLEKGRGTLLERFVLPPVDVTDLIGKPDEEGYAVLKGAKEEEPPREPAP